jgi:O-antigen/teichoic acid export membrane protein
VVQQNIGYFNAINRTTNMREKLLKDVFASTAQIFTNHAASLVIFLITSAYLVKNVYGELNWFMAIFTVIIALLSFGMEPIIVKKLAAGEDIKESAGLFILHTLLTGLVFTIAMLLLFNFTPSAFGLNSSFILLGISFLLTYLASPFKQLANGRQWFYYLAVMSTISNVLRAACLVLLVLTNSFSLHMVLVVFAFTSFIELLLSAWLMIKKTGFELFQFSWNREKYFSLVKESMPLLGVTIFNTSLARFDWIFLGVMTTNLITADYSFTYRVYEICTMPLYIIGPLLLPRFANLFAQKNQNDLREKNEYFFALLKMEIIMASLIGLVLNLAWAPLIDSITGNKYGAANVNTIFILSWSMPFLYVTNFLWTINFAQGRLKLILGIITIAFCINIIGNITLIPLLQGAGAAIAFLIAIAVQTIIYMKRTEFPGLSKIWLPLLICPASAYLSGKLAMIVTSEYWLTIPLAILLFTGLLIISRQIVIKDWWLFKTALGV